MKLLLVLIVYFAAYTQHAIGAFEMNLLPGTCMYINGVRVCALNPVQELRIAERTFYLPSTSTLTLSADKKNELNKICRCSGTESLYSYTVEQTTSGNEKIITKITPNTPNWCDCYYINRGW